MIKENFKKYEETTFINYGNFSKSLRRIIPTIIDIAINLKEELRRLEMISQNNEELRKDSWQDIKNLSKCINELVDDNIVTLDEKNLKIIEVKQIS